MTFESGLGTDLYRLTFGFVKEDLLSPFICLRIK